MKEIKFGFANDDEPKALWEGIGIRDGLLLTEAIYYGAIGHNKDNFIVFKVENDEYGHYPNLVGKFVVIDALVDVYADGSCTLFLNQEQSITARRAEMFLNDERVRDKITSIDDVIRVCDGMHQANNFFKLVELSPKILATSIRTDVFADKVEALKNCTQNFSDAMRTTDSNKLKR